MGLRSWKHNALLVAIIFVVGFVVLRQDRFRAAVVNKGGAVISYGQAVPVDPLCLPGQEEGCVPWHPPYVKDDGSFDEEEEEGHLERLTSLRKNIAVRAGRGAIYRASIKDLDYREEIFDAIREKTALLPTNFDASQYTGYKANAYKPRYTTRDAQQWTEVYEAKFLECPSPWQAVDAPGTIRAFKGRPKSFPAPVFGSALELGWETNICFERQGRWGPYNFVEKHHDSEVKEIGWDKVNWGEVQEKCFDLNKDRFELHDHGWGKREDQQPLGYLSDFDKSKFWQLGPDAKENTVAKRTAVIVRATYQTHWHQSDTLNLRALIKELSIHTGGEYQVFLLIRAHEDDTSFLTWKSAAHHEMAVRRSVPEEFRSITHIYSETLLRSWYLQLPRDIHGNDFDTKFSHLALQRFAHLNPSFAYFFQTDLYTRFTGHWYDLLKSLPAFGLKVPRKLSWEKSERLYIPSLHGDYFRGFRDAVNGQVAYPEGVVWEAPKSGEFEQHGPRPPPQLAENEHYMWGVGEEADLITLAPIFDANATSWVGRGEVLGYKMEGQLPRRAFLGTEFLISKLLLDTMHAEALAGRFLNKEMAAATAALLHGLKVVAAPVPVYVEHAYTAGEAAEFFNSGPRHEVGRSAKSSYGRESQEFWMESTYSRNSYAAAELWDQWMGRNEWKYDVSAATRLLPAMTVRK